MKQIKKRKPGTHWMGVARTVSVIFLLAVWMAACNIGTDQDPEPEPEDTNNLTSQVVVVSNTENQVETNESRQCVAPLKDGGFAIVFSSGGFPNRHIMMQWIDAQGKQCLEDGGMPITSDTGDAELAVVIDRPSGGVYVAFSQDDGQGYRVKAQAFDKTMTPLWPEPVAVSIFDSGWEAQREPWLALDPSGGFYVGFHCYNITERYQVKCQRLNMSGNRMWGETGESLCSNYHFVTYPRIVLDKSGGLYVFWMNLRDYTAPAFEPVLLEGQHLTSGGAKTWGYDPKIIRTTNSPATNFYLHNAFMAAPDGYGGAIVTWTEDFDIYDQQLYVLAQKVNIDGALLWNNGVILNDTNRFSVLDGIIAANDGGVFISTYDYISDSASRLNMQRLGAQGEKLWTAYGIELSKPDEQHLNYGVYGYFTGKYLNICWTYQREPNTYDIEVVTGRFKADGTFMDPPGGVILDNTGAPQFSRGMVYNEFSKEYFVLWEDGRNSFLRHDFDILGAILKNTAFSTPTLLSQSVAPLLSAKKRLSPEPFRMGNNNPNPHQPFDLPGQKVVRLEDN